MVFFMALQRHWQEDHLVNATGQKHQSAIQTKNENEPTSGKYFMICQTCFWCASYIDIMGNIDALTYNVCPTCNHTTIELLPLSNDEHYRFENSATRGIILELGENPSGNYKSIFKASHFSHLL
jgi:hypothetical protein